jgi:hypothetical protein
MRQPLDALADHILRPADRLEDIRDTADHPESFLWPDFASGKGRSVLAAPQIGLESGVAHFVRRPEADRARYTRVLKMEQVSLHGLLRPVSAPEGSEPFLLATIIREDGTMTPPARLRAAFDDEDVALWHFAIRKDSKPRLFFMADARDLLYLEFCVRRPDRAEPVCIGFSTMEVGSMLRPAADGADDADSSDDEETRNKRAEARAAADAGDGSDAEEEDLTKVPAVQSVAMWVNGGNFYNRRKPNRRALGEVKTAGCFTCGGFSEEELQLALGTLVVPPKKLFPAAPAFDPVRLRLLPRVTVLPFYHMAFLLAVRRQMHVAQETAPCYMVMRQDPYRLAMEIIADHARLDVAALEWINMCTINTAMHQDDDRHTVRELTRMVAELHGLFEVGGAEQQHTRLYATKKDVERRVKVKSSAPNHPMGHALSLLSASRK